MKVKEYIEINELEDDLIQIKGLLCVKETSTKIKPEEILGIATEDIKKEDLK